MMCVTGRRYVLVEIRCSKCHHIGPAAEVRPKGTRLELICANCGHANTLELGASSEATSTEVASDEAPERPIEESEERAVAVVPAPDEVRVGEDDATAHAADVRAQTKAARAVGGADATASKGAIVDTEQVMERMIPEPGEGVRCRKCAALLQPHHENCPRCGLNVAESHRYDSGEAPWEQPPAGQEAAFEQAELLWESVTERWDAEHVGKFHAFVREEGLYEYGIRKLRFWLAEYPDDDLALEPLRDLAKLMQSRAIVATSQAQANVAEFEEGVARARVALVVGTLVLWGGIFLLFLLLFVDNC